MKLFKTTVLVVFLSVFFLQGCGYKELQQDYYVTKQLEITKKYEYKAIVPQNTDLLKLELYEDGKIKAITMGNPYLKNDDVMIEKPDMHPGYWLAGKVISSPFVSIIAGGWAAKQMMEEAGDHISGSYNSGSNNSSTGAMSLSTNGSANMDNSVHNNTENNSVNDSYNDSSNRSVNTSDSNNSTTNTTEQSYTDSYNTQTNDSVNDSYWTDDNSDNSQWQDDHRADYENDNSANNDYRSGYSDVLSTP